MCSTVTAGHLSPTLAEPPSVAFTLSPSFATGKLRRFLKESLLQRRGSDSSPQRTQPPRVAPDTSSGGGKVRPENDQQGDSAAPRPSGRKLQRGSNTFKTVPPPLGASRMHFSVLNLRDVSDLICGLTLLICPPSPFPSSGPACQSEDTPLTLLSLCGCAQRNRWPYSESVPDSCQGYTSCFCLTQAVHCHHQTLHLPRPFLFTSASDKTHREKLRLPSRDLK